MNKTTVWCRVKHCNYAEEIDGTGLYCCTKEIISLCNGICEDYETNKLCVNCLRYSEFCDEGYACMKYLEENL